MDKRTTIILGLIICISSLVSLGISINFIITHSNFPTFVSNPSTPVRYTFTGSASKSTEYFVIPSKEFKLTYVVAGRPELSDYEHIRKYRRNNVACISIGLGSENLVMNRTSIVIVKPAKMEIMKMEFDWCLRIPE